LDGCDQIAASIGYLFKLIEISKSLIFY